MKIKSLALLWLVVILSVMLCSCSSQSGEVTTTNAPARKKFDVFKLHSGTQFGMTSDEVIELERQAGFTADTSELQKDNKLKICGKIAGQNNTDAYYYFSANKLYEMRYYFKELEQYQAIEQSLQDKYGVTQYGSHTGIGLPEFSINGDTYSDNHNEGIFSTGSFWVMRIQNCQYSQRIIQISETEYVFIEHYCANIVYDWSRDNSKSVYPNHYVQYTLLSSTEVAQIFGDVQQLDSDL